MRASSKTWDVEGAGPDVKVKAATAEAAAKKVAKAQYGELGRVVLTWEGSGPGRSAGEWSVKVAGVKQTRRIVVTAG